MKLDWNKIIYPGLAALFTAALFYLLDVLGAIPTLILPSKAVVAFKLVECPSGWGNYEPAIGRTIIGVGKADNLSNRTLEQSEGVEKYSLSEPQMPKHQHNTPQAMDNTGTNFGLGPKRKSVHGVKWADASTEMTSWEGNGETVNNMPPFVALKYCMKK